MKQGQVKSVRQAWSVQVMHLPNKVILLPIIRETNITNTLLSLKEEIQP